MVENSESKKEKFNLDDLRKIAEGRNITGMEQTMNTFGDIMRSNEQERD